MAPRKSAAAAKTAAAPAKTAAAKKAAAKTNGVAKPKAAATKAAPAAPKRPAKKVAKPSAIADENKENADPKPLVNGVATDTDAAAPKTTAAAKKTATPKAPAAKKEKTPAPAAAEKTKAAGTKRKADEIEEAEEEEATDKEASVPPAKAARKTKDAASPAAAVAKKLGKIGVKINSAPTKPVDIFVFGEGSSGELGLGAVRVDNKKPMDVKRPRLNTNLDSDKVGVVQIATGGMHAVALTKDNKILTWGVNDQGALGRNTNWDGGLRDADKEDESDSDDDDTGLNPRESTPLEIDTSDVIPGTKFVHVSASDSASFALTEDGRIYGWGTFRAHDGVLGFSREVRIQKTPVLLPEPKKVKAIATGSNHIMALDAKGKLYTWGCPEQNQLGRRCVQRDIKESALRPGGVGFKRGTHITKISCGSYHSFALDDKGRVFAWGLNNFGQLNVEQGAGDTDATVLDATLMTGLDSYKIVDIDGGEHHSLACTEDGKLLTWGRIDGHQVGLKNEAFTEENAIFDEHGRPRILKEPTVVPDIPAIAQVSAGTDNSFALTTQGKAYSWGFSANYQTGQGTCDDIELPTLIDNTAVRERRLIYTGAGGQFSILASLAGAAGKA